MSDNDGKVIIKEDAPHMRSVQIMPASELLMPKATPIIVKKSPLLFSQSKSEISTDQYHPDCWKTVSLSPVPPIYLLERTHIYVKDSAQSVADRIVECFRLGSMAAVYHQDETAVDVETQDNVHMTVRLWEGTKKGPGYVLVEVQKVSGCGYAYCTTAKAVLRAAKGIQATTGRTSKTVDQQYQQPPQPRASTPPLPVPRSITRVEQDPKEGEATMQEGLDIAVQMLAKDQHDARLLAIESLEQLSRCTEHRCFIARSILSSDDPCFKALLGLMLQSNPSQDLHESNSSEVEKEYHALMRRYSLRVMANCLMALEQADELVQFLEEQVELTSRPLLEALTEDLSCAQERPHEACHAAKCLRSLLMMVPSSSSSLVGLDGSSSSVTLRRKALAQDLGVHESLSEAQRIGGFRHVGLEGACIKFGDIL